MYYFYIFAKSFSLIFPRNFCYKIAGFLATTQYYFSKKDRLTVINNLLPVVGDDRKIKEIARKVFVNFAYYLVDFFRYSRLNSKFIKKYVKVEGLEHLDRAVLNKKGVMAVTAHLGNYELAGAITSLLGYKLYAVALSHKDARVNRFFNSQREMAGIEVIQYGIAAKKCLPLLNAGEFIAFLGDRNFSGSGIKVEMFSRKVLLPRGPAFFAFKTEAAFIPAFFVRENKKYYRLVFEKPIDTKRQNSEEEIMKEYAVILEKYIKKYPEQWYLFSPYWIGG